MAPDIDGSAIESLQPTRGRSHLRRGRRGRLGRRLEAAELERLGSEAANLPYVANGLWIAIGMIKRAPRNPLVRLPPRDVASVPSLFLCIYGGVYLGWRRLATMQLNTLRIHCMSQTTRVPRFCFFAVSMAGGRVRQCCAGWRSLTPQKGEGHMTYR